MPNPFVALLQWNLTTVQHDAWKGDSKLYEKSDFYYFCSEISLGEDEKIIDVLLVLLNSQYWKRNITGASI